MTQPPTWWPPTPPPPPMRRWRTPPGPPATVPATPCPGRVTPAAAAGWRAAISRAGRRWRSCSSAWRGSDGPDLDAGDLADPADAGQPLGLPELVEGLIAGGGLVDRAE